MPFFALLFHSLLHITVHKEGTCSAMSSKSHTKRALWKMFSHFISLFSLYTSSFCFLLSAEKKSFIILSSSAHTHVVPNLYDLPSFIKQKKEKLLVTFCSVSHTKLLDDYIGIEWGGVIIVNYSNFFFVNWKKKAEIKYGVNIRWITCCFSSHQKWSTKNEK